VKLSRTTRFFAVHFLIWGLSLLTLFVIQSWANRPILRWIRVAGWVGLIVYGALLSVAQFGIGPLGRRLSDATRKDERDSWNRGH
jgi:hypothetical protein